MSQTVATLPQVAAEPSIKPRVFTKVAIGDMQIGIDVRHVVFAHQRPATLTRLPRSEGALDGVFTLQGQVVPLVDLRRWMDKKAIEDLVEPALVMVLQSDGATVGLAVDAVKGLVRLPASSVRQVHHDEAEDGFFHSVGMLDDGGLISLLDPARLMTQTQAWVANACGEDSSNGVSGCGPGGLSTRVHHGASTKSQVLVRIGATVVGVEVTLVAEVRQMPPLQQLALGVSVLRGMMHWHGHHVPVLDPDKVAGIAHPTADTAPLVMVLAYEGRYAALPIDSVLAVRQFPYAVIQRPEDAGLDADSCFVGLTNLEDKSPVLLINARILLDHYAMDGLPSSAASALSVAKVPAPDPLAYVVFAADPSWALPLNCMEEIIPLPADFCLLPGRNRSTAGNCTWRGRLLPIVDVRGSSVGDPLPAHQRVIVVHNGERFAGLWVDEVTALLPSNSAHQTRLTIPGAGQVQMLTVGKHETRRSYRILNLAHLPFFSLAAG